MCSNGFCAKDVQGDQSGTAACDTIPARGAGSLRCPDGSLGDGATGCASVAVGACPDIRFPFRKPVPQQRCQDGVCRYRCPSYNGCPWQKPYQCSNRECALNAGSCGGASIGAAYNFGAIRNLILRPLQNNETNAVVGRRLLADTLSSATAVTTAAATKLFTAALNGLRRASGNGTDPAPNPAGPPISTGTVGWTPCFDNCASMIKLSPAGATVPLTTPSKLQVAFDDNGQLLVTLDVPAGALVLANASQYADGAAPSRVSISWGPVSDGTIQGAENRIPSSRAETLAPSGFLTYTQSVLSTVVSLSIDDAVVVPFKQNFTMTATIDRIAFATASSQQLNFSDICLAKLKTIPSISYAAWRCLYCNKQVTDSNGRESTITVRCPINNVTNAGDVWQVSGSFGEPGVYAFVLAPTAEPVPPDGLSWVQENALWLFLGLTGAAVFIFFVLYCAQRLYRYRGKYHEEARAVKEQEEEVATMEQFGGQAGTKDEEVVMKSNPLVTQMKDMQARLDQTQLAIREQENKQKAEATVVRHEHIQELQADRDALAEELNRMRAEIEAVQSTQSSSRPQPVHMAPVHAAPAVLSSGLIGVGVASSDSDYPGAASTDDVELEGYSGGAGAGGAQQQRSAFQAQRPKKNRKEDL
jgi:hypothetical protein